MSAIARLNIETQSLPSETKTESQAQTSDTFGYKWARRDTYESQTVQDVTIKWLVERYCANNPEKLNQWLAGNRKIILDAGCGAGFSASLLFGEHLRNHDYLGVDISSSIKVAEKRFLELGYPGEFLQCDLMALPIAPNTVDMIYSEGVLHHTDSTEAAIKYLATKLKLGGRFLFYVYAKKAVIREFSDDYIRDQLKGLDDENAWQALEPLTKLGQELGRLDCEISVPDDIPFLGIKKGKVNLQRLFYWNICKLFYHPDYTLKEMNHVNFDWFRPLNCHRQTPEEVKKWVKEASMRIEHMDIQRSGITVVAVKED